MFGKSCVDSNGVRDGVRSIKDSGACSRAEGKPLSENGSGKILIEVNLSRQNLHDHEITEIIKEIFELNNHDLEVKKVVMPVGEDTWQISRANVPEDLQESAADDLASYSSVHPTSRRRKRLQLCNMKLLKQNKLLKVRIPQILKQNLRKKLSARYGDQVSRGVLNLAEVHHSPGITNLLSQVYPNPYRLISLMEVNDGICGKDDGDAAAAVSQKGSCKIQYKAQCELSVKESDVAPELEALVNATDDEEYPASIPPMSVVVSVDDNDDEDEDYDGDLEEGEEYEIGEKAEEEGAFLKSSIISRNMLFRASPSGEVGLERFNAATSQDLDESPPPVKVKRMKMDPNVNVPAARKASLEDGEIASFPNHERCLDLGGKKSKEDFDAARKTFESRQKHPGDLSNRVLIDESQSKSGRLSALDVKQSRKRTAGGSNVSVETMGSDRLTIRKRNLSNSSRLSVKDKVPLSSIHPLSLQKSPPYTEEQIERENENKFGQRPREVRIEEVRSESKSGDGLVEKFAQKLMEKLSEKPSASQRPGKAPCKHKKQLSEKRKYEIQYLKLIKNMFEAKEKDLQGKINNALNFVLDQIDKTEKKIPRPQQFQVRQPTKPHKCDYGQGLETTPMLPPILVKKHKNVHSQTPQKIRTKLSQTEERAESEKGEKEKADKESVDKEKAEEEKAEKERAEMERAEKERAERERAEKERVKKEKAEKERAEKERIKKERAEKEKAEKEKAEKERAEKERVEKERAEKERAEKERAEKEKAEKERAEKERAEKERAEKERAEKERVEKERADKERAEKEQAEKENSERHKTEKEERVGKEVQTLFEEIMGMSKDIEMTEEVIKEYDLTEDEAEVQVKEVVTFKAPQGTFGNVKGDEPKMHSPKASPISLSNKHRSVGPLSLHGTAISLQRSSGLPPLHAASASQQRTTQLDPASKSSKSITVPDHKKPAKFGEVPRGDGSGIGKKKSGGIDKSPQGLQIDIINRNAQETNRKIDFLIRHIDNSMNWLSQSQKSDSSNLNSIIEKAKDLTDKLEKNLRSCKGTCSTVSSMPSDRIGIIDSGSMSSKKSDLLVGESYHSLHIFPTDQGIGSVRISADSMKLPVSGKNGDYLLWQSGMLKPTSLSNFLNVRNRLLKPKKSINYMTTIEGTSLASGQKELSVECENGRELSQPAEETQERGRQQDNPDEGVSNVHRTNSLGSEVPELLIASAPVLISVESSNEMGSFAENVGEQPESVSLARRSSESIRQSRRKRDNSKFSTADIKTALYTEEMLLRSGSQEDVNVEGDRGGREMGVLMNNTNSIYLSSFTISTVALEQSRVLKPVVVQEITWNAVVPVVLSVVDVHYRKEHHIAQTTMEPIVLHVAISTHFLVTVTMSTMKVVEEEPREQPSMTVFSPQISDKSVSEDQEIDEESRFVVLPTPADAAENAENGSIHATNSDEDAIMEDIKVLKKAEFSRSRSRRDVDGNEEGFSRSWDSLQSVSSTELFDGDKPDIGKGIESLLPETKKISKIHGLEHFSQNLPWAQPIPDPYESNAAEEDAEHVSLSEGKNFHALRSSPNQILLREGRNELFMEADNAWMKSRKSKFDNIGPLIFRYLSSETSNTSVDEKRDVKGDQATEKKAEHPRRKMDFKFFPEIKKSLEEKVSSKEVVKEAEEKVEEAIDAALGNRGEPVRLPSAEKEPSKEESRQFFGEDYGDDGDEEDDDEDEDDEDGNNTSSSSSFKSSNDCSDDSAQRTVKLVKKKDKTRSLFLDKLYHELRTLRKSFSKRRDKKRRSTSSDNKEGIEFEDALSDVNEDEKELLLKEAKTKVGESVSVNTTPTNEVALPVSHPMPRKVFKTSFKGKESVTELMIDLKDIAITEVSDISVEKQKLSTDHTKISIVISKQGNEAGDMDTSQSNHKAVLGNESETHSSHQHPFSSTDNSYYSFNKSDKGNPIKWKESESESEEDNDDDYKSISSSPSSRSVASVASEKKEDPPFRVSRDDMFESRFGTYGKHKFDFYKKMESTSSLFDGLKMGGKELMLRGSGRYDKELEPLSRAITDMQVRVRDIQKNSFYTSDEYYERALRMARMSAGYCQSCKSRTVIPEDPIGFYRKLIPRATGNARNSYGKQRKYYFKATSSTNSSFYSIHSSNSDVTDKCCHLNSSSILTKGLSRNRGSIFRDAAKPPVSLFLDRAINF